MPILKTSFLCPEFNEQIQAIWEKGRTMPEPKNEPEFIEVIIRDKDRKIIASSVNVFPYSETTNTVIEYIDQIASLGIPILLDAARTALGKNES